MTTTEQAIALFQAIRDLIDAKIIESQAENNQSGAYSSYREERRLEELLLKVIGGKKNES